MEDRRESVLSEAQRSRDPAELLGVAMHLFLQGSWRKACDSVYGSFQRKSRRRSNRNRSLASFFLGSWTLLLCKNSCTVLHKGPKFFCVCLAAVETWLRSRRNRTELRVENTDSYDQISRWMEKKSISPMFVSLWTL